MTQFVSLYKKNFTYWKRSKCGSICEILTSVVFALLLMWFKSLSEDTEKKGTSYLTTTVQLTPPDQLSSLPFPLDHKTYLTGLSEIEIKGVINQLFK